MGTIGTVILWSVCLLLLRIDYTLSQGLHGHYKHHQTQHITGRHNFPPKWYQMANTDIQYTIPFQHNRPRPFRHISRSVRMGQVSQMSPFGKNLNIPPFLRKYGNLQIRRRLVSNINQINPRTIQMLHVPNQRLSHLPTPQMNQMFQFPIPQMNQMSHLQSRQMNQMPHLPSPKMNQMSHIPSRQMNQMPHLPNPQMNQMSHLPSRQMNQRPHIPSSQMSQIEGPQMNQMNTVSSLPMNRMFHVPNQPSLLMNGMSRLPSPRMNHISHVLSQQINQMSDLPKRHMLVSRTSVSQDAPALQKLLSSQGDNTIRLPPEFRTRPSIFKKTIKRIPTAREVVLHHARDENPFVRNPFMNERQFLGNPFMDENDSFDNLQKDGNGFIHNKVTLSRFVKIPYVQRPKLYTSSSDRKAYSVICRMKAIFENKIRELADLANNGQFLQLRRILNELSVRSNRKPIRRASGRYIMRLPIRRKTTTDIGQTEHQDVSSKELKLQKILDHFMKNRYPVSVIRRIMMVISNLRRNIISKQRLSPKTQVYADINEILPDHKRVIRNLFQMSTSSPNIHKATFSKKSFPVEGYFPAPFTLNANSHTEPTPAADESPSSTDSQKPNHSHYKPTGIFLQNKEKKHTESRANDENIEVTMEKQIDSSKDTDFKLEKGQLVLPVEEQTLKMVFPGDQVVKSVSSIQTDMKAKFDKH